MAKGDFMVRFSLAALIGALAITGAAQAQVTKVTSFANSNSTLPADYGAGKGVGPGGAYNSFVQKDKNAITFESSNAATGPYTYTSTTGVDLTIKNGGSGVITPQIHSQITPAGLGFYLADLTGCSPGFGTCAQATGTGMSFSHLSIGASNVVTLADFDFSIVTGDSILYEASGAVGLQSDSLGHITTWQTFNDSTYDLNGFGVELGDKSAFAYNWDATDVFLTSPFGLASGQSRTISYRNTVDSYSPHLCVGATSVCLVSYAGFGDPIGRGGGPDSLSVIRPFDIGPGGIDGLQFDSFTMYTDNYKDGTLDTTAPGNSAAPEPAVWISMVLGFGLLGGALRRRRSLATA